MFKCERKMVKKFALETEKLMHSLRLSYRQSQWSIQAAVLHKKWKGSSPLVPAMVWNESALRKKATDTKKVWRIIKFWPQMFGST